MPDMAFVSMPFGDNPESLENEWTKLFVYGLKPLEEPIDDLPKGTAHEPIELWRADIKADSLNLKLSIMRAIERCTYVICVLTTAVVDGTHGLRLHNPNVLWELGYAEAIGKPIIVMADSDDLKRLPILSGQPRVCVYDHNKVKTATTTEAPVKLRFIAKRLVPFLPLASDEARMGRKALCRTRVIAYPRRDIIKLDDMISNARHQVDILTTDLTYFQFGKLTDDSHPIKRALDNGAAVRIVTMDPESVIAEYRAKQLIRAHGVAGYRRELREGIVKLFKRFGNNNLFSLHIYNDLPLQITFRVDETIITSITTRGERARRRMQIQFKLYDEGVTESFISHFQSMFDISTDVRDIHWVLASRR